MKTKIYILLFITCLNLHVTMAQVNRYEKPAKSTFSNDVSPIDVNALVGIINQANSTNAQTQTSRNNQQRDLFDESLESLNKLNDALLDCMASFMEFPEIHSNTVKVYDRVLEIKNVLKEQAFDPLAYRNPQALMSNPKVQEYYRKVNEMQMYAAIFEELLRPMKGYNYAGLSQTQMSTLDPLFKLFGWSIALLNINCKDAYFYEYSLKGFKMMFIKNALPPDDISKGFYHTISVDFFYDYGIGGTYYIGGGLYRMIQYKDDTVKNYHKVVRATSIRKF